MVIYDIRPFDKSVDTAVGIVVDAKDKMATDFYTHFGFMPLAGQPDKLILPSSAFDFS